MKHRYVKHPDYQGKLLTLQVGRQNKKILDDMFLYGQQWEKFVAHGLLVRLEEEQSLPQLPVLQPKKEEVFEAAPIVSFVTHCIEVEVDQKVAEDILETPLSEESETQFRFSEEELSVSKTVAPKYTGRKRGRKKKVRE